MIVTVALFAKAQDLAGQSNVSLELPANASVRQLRIELGRQYPQMIPILPNLFVAINEDYASDDQQIPEDATLACFPPVSGG